MGGKGKGKKGGDGIGQPLPPWMRKGGKKGGKGGKDGGKGDGGMWGMGGMGFGGMGGMFPGMGMHPGMMSGMGMGMGMGMPGMPFGMQQPGMQQPGMQMPFQMPMQMPYGQMPGALNGMPMMNGMGFGMPNQFHMPDQGMQMPTSSMSLQMQNGLQPQGMQQMQQATTGEALGPAGLRSQLAARGLSKALSTVSMTSAAPESLRPASEARRWGDLLWWQYIGSNFVDIGCQNGEVALHAEAAHKNELTLQHIFEALCERSANLHDYPANRTLISSPPRRHQPWYAQTAQCQGARFKNMTKEALDAKLASAWWHEEVQRTAQRAAQALDRRPPTSDQAARFLSAVVDCVVVHACTGLQDFPHWAVDKSTSLPGEHGLLGQMDRAETKDIRWAFDYWQSKSKAEFQEYAGLYYGYLLAIIADILKAGSGDFKTPDRERGPRLTITVVSDTNLVPVLAMYGLKKAASRRPPYLSALIHELYVHRNGSHFIRVLYNGRVQEVCHGYYPLCPLKEWEDLVEDFTPSRKSCPVLHEAYDFQVPRNRSFSRSSIPFDVRHLPEAVKEVSDNPLSKVLPMMLVLLCCLCLGSACGRRRRPLPTRTFDNEEGLREALMT